MKYSIHLKLIHTNWFSMAGNMSSKALTPTVEWRLSKVFAAACLTSGNGSQRALRTVGTKLLTKVRTMSLLVEAIISDSPIQTPCRWSGWSDSRPFSKMGIISGSTRSPNFLTKSPNVLAATWKWQIRYETISVIKLLQKVIKISCTVK